MYDIDREIENAYREDTVGRKYHAPIISKKHAMSNENTGENSEPMSVQTNKPMTWNEFKQLSRSLKIAYLANLREQFNVSQAQLSRMFGVHQCTVLDCVNSLGIHHRFKGAKMTKDEKKVWNEFIAKHSTVEPEPIEPIEETVTPTPIAPLTSFSLRFDGPFNSSQLANTLKRFMMDGTPCSIYLSVNDIER